MCRAPLVFIGLQALQVVLSPTPGEATGVLGGYLFGTWLGLLYSTIGLTIGSALAFGLSRRLGLGLVRRMRIPGTWLLSAQGGAASSSEYGSPPVLVAVAAAVALLSWIYRRRILHWIRRVSDPSLSDLPTSDQ